MPRTTDQKDRITLRLTGIFVVLLLATAAFTLLSCSSKEPGIPATYHYGVMGYGKAVCAKANEHSCGLHLYACADGKEYQCVHDVEIDP